jgi:hypothetical protein
MDVEPHQRLTPIFMTTTHKYSNGRPVMAGDLCLADLDDSVAGQNSGGRPAAGRVTKLLDDDRIEIAIAPNGYPVIASTNRALSPEDTDAREYKEPSGPVLTDPPAEPPAPTPQEDPAPAVETSALPTVEPPPQDGAGIQSPALPTQ